jgi:predicted O-methyltransferase YrrM
MLQPNPDIEQYILEHIDAEPPLLAELNRTTHVRCLYSNMCSGHLQGRILKMLVRMIRPKRVLELGTFTGYSALCLAEGLEPGCEVHTVEINDELSDMILEYFEKSGYEERLHLHIGDASEIVPQITTEPWDMVFIDANKRTYCEYYHMVKPLVRQGGFILADNTLWYGKTTDGSSHDAQTLGIMEFNRMIAEDDSVEKVMLPLRDGITIIWKK